MTQLTFVQAAALQLTLEQLTMIKTELAVPATQTVIRLTKRTLPPAPPAALTTALADVESFLLAQAVTAIDDQITAAQASFDAL